jgi:hypothetical protein
MLEMRVRKVGPRSEEEQAENSALVDWFLAIDACLA